MNYSKLLSTDNFIKIGGNKKFNIYGNEKALIIQGKSQDGNNYIIDYSPNIIKQLLNLNTNIDKSELIWLHGNGPSPHFILYKKNNLNNLIDYNDILKIDNFVKGKLPSKSNKSLPLECSLLSNVKKTNVIGMVTIKKEKLTNLLK
jgi:hypothetical protein